MDDQTALLPDVIALGATTYKVVSRDALWREQNGCDGMIVFTDMEINIVADRPRSEVANTLIHECLHACYREWHIKPKCGEERTVTALGYAITALYAQNPDLLASISELLSEE